MAFERIQALGDEKFTHILNHLMRGDSCTTLARQIQLLPPNGWGDLQQMAERSLKQQLLRLRHAAAEGAFGANAKREIARVGKPHVDKLAHVSVKALVRMEELTEKQRTLVLALLEKATAELHVAQNTNVAVDIYRKMIVDLQKIRFDLGLDEFKGPIGTSIRGISQTTTYPDGMSVQKQVFEAVNTVEQIFNARRIPYIADKDE